MYKYQEIKYVDLKIYTSTLHEILCKLNIMKPKEIHLNSSYMYLQDTHEITIIITDIREDENHNDYLLQCKSLLYDRNPSENWYTLNEILNIISAVDKFKIHSYTHEMYIKRCIFTIEEIHKVFEQDQIEVIIQNEKTGKIEDVSTGIVISIEQLIKGVMCVLIRDNNNNSNQYYFDEDGFIVDPTYYTSKYNRRVLIKEM